jgi:hypothetical protein
MREYSNRTISFDARSLKALERVRSAKRYLSDSHAIRELIIEADEALKSRPNKDGAA